MFALGTSPTRWKCGVEEWGIITGAAVGYGWVWPARKAHGRGYDAVMATLSRLLSGPMLEIEHSHWFTFRSVRRGGGGQGIVYMSQG